MLRLVVSNRPAGWREEQPLADSVGGGLQVLAHGSLVDAEGAPDADCRQVASVNQTVNGHLGDSHDLCDLSDRQKGSLFFINHIYLTLQPVARCRLPLPQDEHARA